LLSLSLPDQAVLFSLRYPWSISAQNLWSVVKKLARMLSAFLSVLDGETGETAFWHGPAALYHDFPFWCLEDIGWLAACLLLLLLFLASIVITRSLVLCFVLYL